MNYKALKITCINVHTSNHITHAILQDHANPETSNTDIIIITEPWIGVVRSDTQEKGTNSHYDWKCIVPANIKEARVAIYVRKSANIKVIPLLHEPYKRNDILTARISLTENESFLLYAVYNSPSDFSASNFLIDNVFLTEPTVMIGDFNLHSPNWDATVTSEDRHTSSFTEWLTDNSLRVLNDPNKPTYFGHHYQHKKVDDLVISNIDLFRDYEINPVTVESVRHYASDHAPISTLITYTGNEADIPSQEPNFSFSKEKKDKWIEHIGPILENILLSIPISPSNTDLDSTALAIMNATTQATQKVMEPTRISPYHTKHWWNEDLSNAINDLRQQAAGVKATQNPYLIHRYERSKKVFKEKIRFAKNNWATKRLEDANETNIWEFIRWYSHGGKRNRPIYSSPSNIPAESDDERAEKLTNQFFPDPPPAEPYQPQYPALPKFEFPPLQPHEIDDAIKDCSMKSTPGPSNINYRAVQWIRDACPELFPKFFGACFANGHYPTPFKHSSTAVVPKPGKDDYSSPSAFRPIQLLEVLGKILDKIMARRIQYIVAKNDIVPSNQFGGRILSSTIDAGLALTQEIHDAWDKGLKVSVLQFDISGYFNFVNHKGLIERLQHFGFDDTTIKFIESFLSGRTTSFVFGDYKSDPHNISNGIPQGSPLSPILAIIYAADIVQLKKLILLGIASLAYMDDGSLIAKSKSLETNIGKLQTAFKILTEALTASGLEAQYKKLELQHFTKGADPTSPPFQIEGHPPIVAPKFIRWLGFYLDRHLNFTHHTTIMANRATATIRAMGILGNTVKGMSHVQLRQLTQSTVIPILTYGCQLWWGGRYSKSNCKKLQKSLNGALRRICRAFRTTAVSALQYISHVPPLEHTIHKLCYSSSLRLHRLLPESLVLEKIQPPRFKNIRLSHRSSNTNPIRLKTPSKRISPLHRIARLTDATDTPSLNPLYNKPWDMGTQRHPRILTITPPPKDAREEYNNNISHQITNQQSSENTIVISTDGSRRKIKGKKQTGAGVLIKLGNRTLHKVSLGVGRKTNVYDGESIALLAGMRLAIDACKDNPQIQNLHFYSDSVSAITNITRTHAHPSQTTSIAFSKHAKQFAESTNHKITIQWIPGHKGHAINELADKYARRGCRSDLSILDSSLSYFAEKRSRIVQKKWREDLKKHPLTGAFGEVTSDPPTTKPNEVFMKLQDQPEVFGRLTQMRTMHGYNPHYYHRFLKVEYGPNDLNCICDHYLPPYPARHFRNHVLHNCEAYEDHRHILTKVSRLHHATILLGSKKGLLETGRFLKETGAFSATGTPYQPPETPEIPELELLANLAVIVDDPP
jgi:ribonuclease HI